ncbi:MAG: FMN-binding protein [Pirellulaceae bacterium]|nr:FMN-binding protein [Pirellulaceae bacterium]
MRAALCSLGLLLILVAAAPAQNVSAKPESLDGLINRLGRTPPDWYKDTALNYPATLDLQWPHPAPQGWNNQKNVGQFIWDVINPNPNRWREGVKLMHHLLTVHAQNPETRERVMLELARMYHNLLEDYARAAFWLRAVGVEKDPAEYSRSAVVLAECYWRLGFDTEAKALLAKTPGGLAHAKLLADMGQHDRAIRMALSGGPDDAGYAYLTAGDACRQAGRFAEALGYYQKLLALPVPNPPGRLQRNRTRAQENVAAIQSFELFDLGRVADGTYSAASQGYEGPVEVAVQVRGNKIEAVRVTKHREKQFYSAISDTPKKIIAKQSVKGVDATTSATITSEAIINATAKALAGKN